MVLPAGVQAHRHAAGRQQILFTAIARSLERAGGIRALAPDSGSQLMYDR
jgi:hypothetical protein